MKKLFTLLVLAILCISSIAQNSFYFNILSPTIVRTSYAPGEYSQVSAGDWGWDGTIANTFSGELVYAPEDDTQLHTLCDPLTIPDFTGKIVLIERGGCEFGQKALNAQTYGAIGVVIVNIDDNVITMGAGALGSEVTIPTIMIPLTGGTPLIDLLENGGAITAAFSLSPLDVATVIGNIRYDENLDCLNDPTEEGLAGWQVTLSDPTGVASVSFSNNDGTYYLFGDVGTYDVTVNPPGLLWNACNASEQVTFTQYDTMNVNFQGQSILDCPLMEIDLEIPFLRRCFDNNSYYVRYCNLGTVDATDVYIEIALDPLLSIVSANIPYTIQNGNVLRFDIGNVPYGQCDVFQFTVELSCDAELGQTLCAEAFIYPDTICIPTSGWTGSNIFIDGNCNGDEVVFSIENQGSGPMANAASYIVLKNDETVESGTYQLNAGASQDFSFPADGSTFRLEADQADDYPLDSAPSRTIEGCDPDGGDFSMGFFNVFPPADYGDAYDLECDEVIGAFDPNDKQGFPLGYGPDHYIERGVDIQYLIRFQNTGTDTAFNIVVIDTLIDYLDVSTLRLGPASHDMEFSSQGNILEFKFNDILLVDSFANEPASHGFLTFTISQKENLPLETFIYNRAAIYFDFNEPILTNYTLHTIGENFLPTNSQEVFLPDLEINVFPNPTNDFTIFDLGKTPANTGLFQLFDINGRIVRNNYFNQSEYYFAKENLPSGTYFYKIILEGKDAASGKLIIH